MFNGRSIVLLLAMVLPLSTPFVSFADTVENGVFDLVNNMVVPASQIGYVMNPDDFCGPGGNGGITVLIPDGTNRSYQAGSGIDLTGATYVFSPDQLMNGFRLTNVMCDVSGGVEDIFVRGLASSTALSSFSSETASVRDLFLIYFILFSVFVIVLSMSVWMLRQFLL